MTSEVDGFPIQQAIPLIPLGGAVQGAQTSQAVQPAQPVPSVSSFAASARPKPPQLPLPKSQIPTQWEISSLLSSLGVPARLSGFYYLVDAILYPCVSPLRRAA